MSNLPGTIARRRIYLMRHGHVDYFAPEVVSTRNTRDVILTAEGRLEANAAGRAFAHMSFDRAICTGLRRTCETAEIVLGCLENAPPLEIEPDLAEIRGGGQVHVTSRAELVALVSSHFEKASADGATLMGGEAFVEAQARAIAAVRRILAEPGWKQILIVAHEGINKLVLSWAAGAKLSAAHAFEQDTGCINLIDFDMVCGADGKPGPEIARSLIKAVNLTPYNYVKHGMNLTSLEAIFARREDEQA
ncbi:MAG TPA: histidine phosphatase family protein [Rhizomicrobium sp.]|nr:histidine phosphatase family protein [Rhizomicrobium sp.]